VTNFAEATAGDTAAYATFFHAMLDHGVHLAPSQYEAMFVGICPHGRGDRATITAAEQAFAAVAEGANPSQGDGVTGAGRGHFSTECTETQSAQREEVGGIDLKLK
jgi:hypothetical protein